MDSASTKSNISTSLLFISRGGKFTREKSIDIGVCCMDRQARGFLFQKYRHRLQIWGRITGSMGLVRNGAGLG